MLGSIRRITSLGGSAARDAPKVEASKVTQDAAETSMGDPRIRSFKLERLPGAGRRQTHLKDQRVLIIGSDYGFVCLEAARQGAARVVFLTRDELPENVEFAASDRVELVQGDLKSISGESFDAVFLPNAQACDDLGKTVARIAEFLDRRGVLLIECGCVGSEGRAQWTIAGPPEARRRYPSISLLENIILEDFAVRRVGKGVLSNEDRVTQMMFHCTPMETTALVITGKSGYGKSNLLRFFNPSDFPSISTDGFLSRLARATGDAQSNLARRISEEIGAGEANWGAVGRMIASDVELTDEFCAALINTCPLEAKIFILEGEILRHDNIMIRLTKQLKKKHVRVWRAMPSGA